MHSKRMKLELPIQHTQILNEKFRFPAIYRYTVSYMFIGVIQLGDSNRERRSRDPGFCIEEKGKHD